MTTAAVLIGVSAILAPVGQAQSAGVISQLMPAKSQEERDLQEAAFKRMMAQTPPDPNASQQDRMLRDALLNSPSPTAEEQRWLVLRETVATMEEDYPVQRAIPEGKIVEASVSVRLADGKTLGPYRMYSSFASGFEDIEFANGQQTAFFAGHLKIDPFDPSSFPKTIDPRDIQDFRADGDQRFIGAVLGSVDENGLIAMNVALVIDGRPLRVIRAAAKSGETTVIDAAGGYRLTIKPVLRQMKDLERRWHREARDRPADPNAHRPLRQLNPEWPGPPLVRTGALYFPAMANWQIVCGAWRTKFSNDPKVDISRIGLSPIKLALDASGKPQIVLPQLGAAFAAGAFSLGLAADQTSDSPLAPNAFRHLGRSPTLADVLEFHELDQTLPGLSWLRIRRDGDITYRTEFFLRCEQQASSPKPG